MTDQVVTNTNVQARLDRHGEFLDYLLDKDRKCEKQVSELAEENRHLKSDLSAVYKQVHKMCANSN